MHIFKYKKISSIANPIFKCEIKKRLFAFDLEMKSFICDRIEKKEYVIDNYTSYQIYSEKKVVYIKSIPLYLIYQLSQFKCFCSSTNFDYFHRKQNTKMFELLFFLSFITLFTHRFLFSVVSISIMLKASPINFLPVLIFIHVMKNLQLLLGKNQIYIFLKYFQLQN